MHILLGVVACFVLSGFAALPYQTAWMRQFSLVFGTSELAIAAVLAAYMGGLALGAAIAALGIPAAWSLDVLGVMDQVANNLFLLGGGLALSLFVGWAMEDPVGEVAVGATGVRWFFLWRFLLRFVVPAILGFLLFEAIPGTLQSIGALFSGEAG